MFFKLTISTALTKLFTKILCEDARTRLITSLSWVVTWLIVVHCLCWTVLLQLNLTAMHRPQSEEIAGLVKPDYKINFWCFSANHAALRNKSKNWMARNQNVSEWSDILSIRGLLFQWASTIENSTQHSCTLSLLNCPSSVESYGNASTTIWRNRWKKNL
jgi:hypothetical protein